MIKELNIKEHYREIFKLSQFAFQYTLSEAELKAKREEAERHTIWGVMEEGQLAAKLHLIPLAVSIHGRSMQMGGVASVATWPEFRRNGMVKSLLANALNHMHQNGQVLSYLHPFSVPFYRKYGYEVTFNKKQYKIPFEKLKRNWDESGYVRRTEVDIDLLDNLYSQYIGNYTGALIRDEKWWKQRVLKDHHQIAVAYNENRVPEGYILFHVKDKLFTVSEIAYRSLTGLKLLMEFIGNHDSMAEHVEITVPENDNIPLLLKEPRFETKVNPYFMARVVNVKGFLTQYPFGGLHPSVSLFVEDEFLPVNTGVYVLNPRQEGVTCTHMKGKGKADITCNIQAFTTMFLGYKRPTELLALGLIEGNIEAVNKLEDMIPRQQTYLPDFF
ncbi:GNAT family N-acetyltransferase [Ornithinibacillus sp. BX22]|uniref:GNAT family N-acetyltransferase n=2 Tax=Ornithinibacillus TaxID=484508 RepID=A0A923L8M8_9BACI|nr:MULTISPECIES: GNAT family N-acetyltransferase [Ornithinibacillus]MBC5638592.1 GNAT family N-acetyltransferase [Ornithinibacillus hominis]MBS3682276.1 GNAT family N-acetyltransferase [Ornithinibacillus massiliensis]